MASSISSDIPKQLVGDR